MKLLQFGDIHLDGPLHRLGERAARRRHECRTTLARCLAEARTRKVDAVLIPGDLYEHEAHAADTAHFLAGEFEKLAPVPVFIAPGNHDYHSPRALYASHVWPDNVHIARDARWEQHTAGDGLAVHMFAHTSKENIENMLRGYRVPDGGVHVLNFHGGLNEERFGNKRFCAPFALEDLAATGARWGAVGHYHTGAMLEHKGRLLGAYGGWMESHSFTHPGPQSVLFVTLPPEGPPEVEKFTSSSREYRIVEVDGGGADHLEALIGRIEEALSGCKGQIVRAVCTGQVAPQVAVDQLRAEQIQHECFHLEIETDLVPAYDLERLARVNDTCGAFVRHMQELLSETSGVEHEALRDALYYGLDALVGGEVHSRR